MHCPNTSSQEWKDLVQQVGEKEAWRSFFKYGEVRPPFIRKTLEKKNISKLSKLFGEELAKILIKEYSLNEGKNTFYIPTLTELKKELESSKIPTMRIITNALTLNPSLSVDAIKFFLKGIINDSNGTIYITKGFVTSGSNIINYEQTQDRFEKNYAFVQRLVAKYPSIFKIKDTDNPTTKVVKITPGQPRLFANKDDQKRGGQDERIQEKYFPTNVQKSSVVVKKIAESNHPLSKLAKQLLKYVEKNDVDIELVDGVLSSKGVTYDRASGLYATGESKIYIRKDALFRGIGSEVTILHEVLHSLTTTLRQQSDTNFVKLYEYAKENIKEDFYALTDIDEFLTGIFTDGEFVKRLQSLPATGNKYVNLWEEVLDYILGLFKINKGSTLYDEAFALATQVVDNEYQYNEYLQSEEYAKSQDAFLEGEDFSFIEDDRVLASPQSEQQIFKSIRTKSTEEIAETIDKSLIRTQNDIKYTNYIQSLTLDAIGEISPNKVLKTSMDSAFQTAKGKFETSLRNANDFIQVVKSPEIFNALKEKDAVKLESLINRFNLQGARSYEEVVKAIEQYESIVNNFDRYKEFVRAELTRKGIREVKGKIVEVQSEDVTNQEQDNTEDNLIAQEEIGERFDKGINEVNPRDTASIKVKALVNNIQIPGQFELGIPLYADPSDVFADLLNAGVDMQLSGYTEDAGKYEAFVASLQKNVEARPYLAEVINKLENFKKAGKWDTINQVLTFASKAFANETVLLYKTQKSGTEITGITDIKTVSINRESVEEQVSKAWYAQQMNSNFFIKSATGDRFPNPEKVDQLEQIIEDGKTLQGDDKIKKFQEFFKVMGINLTDTQMAFIAPRLPGELKKTKNFDGLFIKNGMLYNIYMGYRNNLENAFLGQYGLQNEKSSVGKLAKLYYQVNPGLINVPSGKDAAGKSKFSNIQTNFVEIKKRQWKLGDSSILMNSALAQPNKEFWTDVKNNLKTFSLDYFNGMREQESGVDGKVRKDLTANEQTRAMFMKHQENMNTGTYVVFTLSDKTGSIEVKQSKEFFVDDAKIPVGKGTDFILDEKGDIEYTDSLKEKVYNTFVEPEVSRILAAMKHSKDVNVENFDISSQLFYILPMINANSLLDGFRRDLYSNSLSLEEISKNHAKAVGAVVLNEFMLSTEQQINDYLQKGIIKNTNGVYTFPSFKNGYKATDYVNRFRQTGAKGRNLAKLMVMDMKLNYMNAQVKTLQFLRFDPMVAFKMPKGIDKKAFSLYTANEKLKIVGTTWDEFSKRAAALIAPGGQGSWSWETSTGEKYFSKDYRTVTVADVSVKINGTKSDIADAEEFTTMQEHIDYLMSEGKLDLKIWESINDKIKKAGKGGFYKLSGEEMKSVFTPLKPVHVNDVNEGENTGLNRIDYVKSSRYPLIPEHEVGTERDKLRQWMEKNDIQSVNFASGKKLGRPSEVLALFDDNQNFVEPTEELLNKGIQVLSRDGLRTQQEIPHQKDEIATISQMNRTLFDGLLQSTFDVPGLGKVKGGELKSIKEKVRSRLFEMKSAELDKELGDLNVSHRGIYNMLKKVILEDTSGSYGENDLRAIELDPVTGKFMFPLEANFKIKKIQGLINSMISKNVMLKMNGSSFVQVSAVGSKYSFSSLSSGIKSGIVWTDSFAATFKNGPAKLNYIGKKNGKVTPAQVVVSQYIKDSNGKLVDLNDFITEENGVKILDTSKIDPSLLQLVASRIPNQSHVSMLPIEVVGFLPSYMEDTIIVPDGITGQMGSDFDVDKLYAYKSKTEAIKDNEGNIIGYKPTKYSVTSVDDIDNLSEEQLKEFYKDIHWAVLTNPDTYDKITKSVDMDETKAKVAMREEQLEKYKVQGDPTINMPLDFNTSINRFNDNRSGKDGVSIFASLISAQADFQDKVLQLGKEVEGEDTPDPIYIKIGNEVKSFEFIGQTGESESFLYEPGKVPKRSVSDNLNIPFTESVDNAKNQYLREFNWDKKAMSSVGILSMLTTAKKEGIPINFAMDLMSQDSIYTLFDLIDQSQDSFGDFDPNALSNGVIKLTTDYIAKIDTGEYLKGGKTATEHLTDGNRKKNNPLSAEKLSNMWLVGKMLKEEGVIAGAKIREDAEAKGQNLEGVQDEKLLKLSKDLGYKNVNDLLLDYYTTQYDSLELFSRLDGIGTELMTIIGAVYPYTKGIGQDVFSTKQKQNQLNKLSNSTIFLGISKIAGKVSKNDNGILSIDPKGEIGNNIKYSLIKAQEIYQNLFPISTGKHLENIVDTMLADRGLTKDDIGKQSYYNIHNDVFNAIRSYMFTIPDLELFGESLQSVRKRLINGDSSLGKSILDLQQIAEFAKNGFLKNIEVSEQYNGDAFTISFKAPFGTDLDEKAILSGFYELAVSENETVREIARELALYPFATGDAGNIGRFIPIDYYMKDTDFKNAMSSMNDIYSQNMGVEGIRIIKDQIVQNNAEAYAKKFTFLTAQTGQGSNDNVFKRNFRKIINSDSLENVKTFTIKLGDFESDPKAAGIIKSLTISKLTDAERRYASDNKFSMEFKYPAYLLINDKVISEFGDVKDSSVNYLYKRTSDAINGDQIATYERINILGYKNIKEYEFGNASLKSAIKENQTDVSSEEFAGGEEFSEPMEGDYVSEGEDSAFGMTFGNEEFNDFEDFSPFTEEQTSKEGIVYNNGTNYLTEDGKIVGEMTPEGMIPAQSSTNIKPTIDTSREWRGDLESRPVYTPEGVNTMRTSAAKSDEHFGNPFSESGYKGTIKVASIADAVIAYKDWLLSPVERTIVKPEQRAWILDQINQGKLDGATLLYAGKSERRGQGMHPTALAEVVEQLRASQVPTIEELEEQEDKEPMRVAYGAQTFILEGSPQDGYTIWYQEKGSKGKLVNDPNLANRVALTHDAEMYPENVVTLTDMPNNPRYYVDLTGEILSLQDSTFGNQITGDDVVRRVNKALAQQVEVETDVVEITPATDQNIDERTGKMLVIPMGSKDTNMVIFETDKAKFLMNDGQQEAYDFIKGNVERLLRDRKSVRPEDLEKTISFNDPLTEKFSGVIPKAMWDNMIGLAGRGGVGKTTVIRAIMESLDSGNRYRSTSVMYLAPSHTAATVLQESLGLDSEKANDGTVNTIQSAVRRNQVNKSTGNLELMSEEEYINGLKFKNPFSSPDIIIVDESSMVTTEAIKDMLVRTKTDLEIGKTSKMPIFIFMGDYRQLGPFGEMQNKDVNKGIISSTLLLNKEKTKELTQVMRSDNENLHKMYDAIGNEIIDNINRTKNGQQPKQLSFDAYDRLTNKSSENILVVDNVVGVIDDYTDFLKSNNNPYGMFWVHYNQVENANTITLADKIRKSYFQKIGRNIDSSAHRKFSNQDYIEFTNTLEMAGSRFMYTPSTPEVKKLLDDRKIDNVDGEYAIVGGMIKPRSRYKVMDIVKDVQSLHNIVPSLSGVVPNITVNVENVLLYNRQNKLRGYSKILGLSVDMGKYENKMQKGITIKDKQTGEILAKFDMFYGAFKTVQDSLKGLNDTTQMPFVPSYIGSSHTAQGNSIRNVIVGDANIKQNRANPKINQDDIFSSMYVALTRTSGTLTIIKPQGSNIIHNEEVYQGAITDDGKTTVKPVSSIKPASFEPVTSINDDVSEYGSNETFDPLELLLQNSTDEYIDNFINPLFKGETTVTNFKAFMDRFYKETTAFNKSVIGAIVKSGIVTPFKIVIDNKLKDPGQYDNFTKTITINPKLAIGETTDLDGIKQKIHEVIMHEIMHHMTADLLNAKPETLSAEQRKWVESLTNLFNNLQQRMLNDPNHKDALQKAMDQVNNNGFLSASDKSLYYGLTNVHDFVSMLMTDQGFQDFMNNTTFDGQKSFFEKFLDLINNLLKVLGINVKDDSVLKEGITNIIGLIQSRNVSDANSIQKSILAKDARETNISDNFNDIIKFLNIKTNC